MDNNSTNIKEQENTLAGIVGAFLFSLAGGILWFVLYQIGFLAAVSGFIGVICAVKGSTFFSKSKNESLKCVIISSVMTTIVLIAAWYFCVAYDIYNIFYEWFLAGEIDYYYTFFEAVQVAPYILLENTAALIAYVKDLAIGLLCAVLGVIYYLSLREKRMKAEAAKKAATAVYANTSETDEAEENRVGNDVE
jgi:hypothetical protein